MLQPIDQLAIPHQGVMLFLFLLILGCTVDPADVPAADLQHETLTCQHKHGMERWIDHEQGVVCYMPKGSVRGTFDCVSMNKEPIESP